MILDSESGERSVGVGEGWVDVRRPAAYCVVRRSFAGDPVVGTDEKDWQ